MGIESKHKFVRRALRKGSTEIAGVVTSFEGPTHPWWGLTRKQVRRLRREFGVQEPYKPAETTKAVST